MGKKIIVLSFVMLCFTTVRSQDKKAPLTDSLKLMLAKDSARIYRKTIARLFLRIEDRYSFASGRPLNYYGLMAGATFYEHHTLFAGYFITDPLRKSPLRIIENNNAFYYPKVQYAVLGYQYIALRTRYLQLNLPVTIGYGNYKIKETDAYEYHIETQQGKVIPMSAGAQLILKPLRWAGISASGGYRHVYTKISTRPDLSGWFFSLGIWLDGRLVTRYLRYELRKMHYRNLLLRE